ncbi:MAG: hypothetical protein ACRD1N_00795 [Terriglobia bacterium]
MNCLSESLMRAKLDNELAADVREELERHLGACQKCCERMQAIANDAERVSGALSALDESFQTNPRMAYAHFQARSEGAEESPARGGFLTRIFSAHPLPAGAGAVVAVLVIVLAAFAPARSLGQRVLAMLRVERVAVVPVSLSAAPGRSTMETVSRLLSDQVVVTLSPGKPAQAATAVQASRLAGFAVRTLDSEPQAPAISVEGERAFVMTLNRDRLQQVLSALGRPDLQLPASIDGSTLAVHIAKTVMVQYGNCPRRGQRPVPEQSAGAGCTMLMEAPSPIVSVPPELNVSQLAAIALQAAGMTAQEAESFCQTVDWTSTLVVPVPSGATTSTEVAVDGAQGTLILGQQRNGRPAMYDLLWVKKGIIYSLWGHGSASAALGLAGSLS